MKHKALWVGVMCIILCACSQEKPKEEPDVPNVDQDKDVIAYVTSADATSYFTRKTFNFSEPGGLDSYKVTYDKTKLHQEVDGFGLAVTTATCYNLLKMTQEDRTAFLKNMFSQEEGVGSSLIRVAIGASDFCISDEYTWCDKKGLENFAVHPEDRNYLFPVLKEIYAINPDVKIIASPWSCPKWMKGGKWGYEGNDVKVMETDFDSWTSGRLKPSCYQEYSDYFVKWIQTMEAEGFDIFAVTMQNEPLNHGNSMSLFMPWTDQRDFIKVLGPTLEKAGLGDVKILLFDHNYNYDNKASQLGYPLHIYADAEASKWADGSAWHSYGGDVSELDQIHYEHPDKSIYFTEASIGTWNYKFADCLLNDFSSIFLGTLKRGGSGVTLWNLMLDDNRGPHSRHDGACTTCYGGVTISSADYKSITRNSHWFNVAHASAVVKPGARLMESGGYEFKARFEYLMFLNPDNTIGVLILNGLSETQQVNFSNADKSVKYNVPAKSLVSLLWSE